MKWTTTTSTLLPQTGGRPQNSIATFSIIDAALIAGVNFDFHMQCLVLAEAKRCTILSTFPSVKGSCCHCLPLFLSHICLAISLPR